MQRILEVNQEEFYSRAENEFQIEDCFVSAFSFHVRGKKSASNRVLDHLEKKFGSELTAANVRMQ